MTERTPERERGQGGVEMDKIGLVMPCPLDSVKVVNGEGVDFVKGPEVMEMGT